MTETLSFVLPPALEATAPPEERGVNGDALKLRTNGLFVGLRPVLNRQRLINQGRR